MVQPATANVVNTQLLWVTALFSLFTIAVKLWRLVFAITNATTIERRVILMIIDTTPFAAVNIRRVRMTALFAILSEVPAVKLQRFWSTTH